MNQENSRDEMQPEYDIRGGVRGKYFSRYSRNASRELPQAQLRLQESPWIQFQATESRGEHASQSTIRIGAEPIYLTPQLVVGEPSLQ
jgi:hypothetical protein